MTTLDAATALITGASSGIGAATARALAERGATIALVARRQDRLEAVAAEITARGGPAHPLVADITDPHRADNVGQEALDRMDRPDILVNNSGIMLLGTALQTSLNDGTGWCS